MTIIPTGFAQCAVRFQLSGFVRPSFITFGVANTVGDGAQELADAVQQTTGGALDERVDTSFIIGPTHVQLGPVPDGEVADSKPELNTPGTNTMEGAPINCAVLVTKGTSRGGRRGRGRLYFPGMLNEAVVDEAGSLTTGFQTTLNGIFAGWLDGLESINHPMVLLHSTGVSTPGVPDVVTTLITAPVIGTQRRRLGR